MDQSVRTSVKSLIKRSSPEAPARKYLRQLVLLRAVAIMGQLATVIGAHWMLAVPLPLVPLFLAIGFLAIFNLVSWYRLRLDVPASGRELFFQILTDIAVFTVLLYFTGGANNPFAFMYLLPLTIAAAALPAGYSWGITAVTVAAYTVLAFFHVPLAIPGGASAQYWYVIWGSWLNYLITGGLVTYFVVKIATTLREHEALVVKARENELKDHYVVGLGSLAASASHSLIVPLTRMEAVMRELERECENVPSAKAKIETLSGLAMGCKTALFKLLSSVDQDRAAGKQA